MAGKDDWIDDVRRWCFDGADTAAAVGCDAPALHGGVAAVETDAVEAGMGVEMLLASSRDAFDAGGGNFGSRLSWSAP